MSKLRECRACITLGADHVPPDGDPHADLMVITGQPRPCDLEVQLPLSGPSGDLLEFLLDEIGLTRHQVYVTNSIKCMPPGNRVCHTEEIQNCYKIFLSQEIKKVSPKLVVVLGKEALLAVTKGKVKPEHGKIVKKKNTAYMFLHHPAYYALRNTLQDFIGQGTAIKEFLNGTEST